MAKRKTTPAIRASRTGAAQLLAPALAGALFLALPARAGSVSASLAVSVVVPPRAVLSVESEPSSLRITEGDVARGWVEVPKASRLLVRTNTPSGWFAELQVVQGPFRLIEVMGLGSPTQVNAAGGWIAVPYPGTTRPVPFEVSYRFLLSADARPGDYPWPVSLTAVPR